MNALQQLDQPIAAALIPFSELERMATAIAKSGLFGVKEPAQAIALCLIAQAEGLHPAIAARDYNVIQGRPAKTAEAIQREFLKAGGRIEWHQLDDTIADATFSHPAGGEFRCTWDMQRARNAGLGVKDMWKKYPRPLLRSRCVSEGCRTIFPGCTSGMYTPEEVRNMPEKEVAGTVVSMTPTPPLDPPIGSLSPAHKALEARISELGLNRDGVKIWCKQHYQVEHLPDLTAAQSRELLTRLPDFAVTKLMRQIPAMTAADLEALIKSPPEWLKPMAADMTAVMESADTRLTALQNSAGYAPQDPTFGGE